LTGPWPIRAARPVREGDRRRTSWAAASGWPCRGGGGGRNSADTLGEPSKRWATHMEPYNIQVRSTAFDHRITRSNRLPSNQWYRVASGTWQRCISATSVTAGKPAIRTAEVTHRDRSATRTAVHSSCVDVVLPMVVPMVSQKDTVPIVPAASGVGISCVGISTGTAGYGRKCGCCRHVADLPHYLSCAHRSISACNCRRDEVYEPLPQCGQHPSAHAE
jgi:hypothetical protein